MEEDKDCCEVWAQIAPRFDWMKFVDHPEMLTMPHISTGENKYFVNFCPSCGKPARNRYMLAERLLTMRATDGLRAGQLFEDPDVWQAQQEDPNHI